MPKDITLNDQELRAINAYLGEKWADFVMSAAGYLDEDEIDDLETKLEKIGSHL